MLIDEVIVRVKGGDGGKGAATFKRNAQTARGGPDGGNGGNGGNVYFVGIDDILGLATFRYKKELIAEDGVRGGKQNLYGRNGIDLVVPIPIGTRITDEDSKKILEMSTVDQKILIACGGKGGRGNNEFKTATNQAPTYAEKGEPGDEKIFKLELRLIADIGLIGLPNAGKSSLLAELTNAKPKIGDYPFTTLEPNLGVLNGKIIADIPGLIEGASKGKGLGIKFLKHIEKTNILVHCIDAGSTKVKEDYTTVRNELGTYSSTLLEKPEIILLTKSDTKNEDELKKQMKSLAPLKKDILPMSIHNQEQLENFKKKLQNISR